MTFADKKGSGNHSYLFGLPGNPVQKYFNVQIMKFIAQYYAFKVSAFATFHLFVLPAIRKHCGYAPDKMSMPIIHVEVFHLFIKYNNKKLKFYSLLAAERSS